MMKNMTPPQFVLALWPLIDRLLQIAHNIRPLRPDGNSIMSVEIKRYKGRPVILDDGYQVRTGDKIIELHLNNLWFEQRRKTSLNLRVSQFLWEVLSCFTQDLRLLAKQMASEKFGQVVALHGCTLLGTGAKRVGFEIKELPDTLWKQWAQFYLSGIMQLYRLPVEEGAKAMTKSRELKEVWLSKPTFLRRYS